MKHPLSKFTIWGAGLTAAVSLVVPNHAVAQNLPPPASGLQILDLAGLANTGANTPYSAQFVASGDFSTVTFVFRNDPSYSYLSDVSVVDTLGGGNLLVNGDFLTAPLGGFGVPGAGAPSWSYFDQAGDLFPGFRGYEDGNGHWADGATQAYDGIDQTFATTPGDTYTVSFWQYAGGGGYFQRISSNGDTTDTGGNGIDTLVYAGRGLPPTTVPDAGSSMALMATALTGLCGFARRMRK
jgi:hypothetical protein